MNKKILRKFHPSEPNPCIDPATTRSQYMHVHVCVNCNWCTPHACTMKSTMTTCTHTHTHVQSNPSRIWHHRAPDSHLSGVKPVVPHFQSRIDAAQKFKVLMKAMEHLHHKRVQSQYVQCTSITQADRTWARLNVGTCTLYKLKVMYSVRKWTHNYMRCILNMYTVHCICITHTYITHTYM